DPSGISGMTFANEALQAIAAADAAFTSRGDDSGTHIKEKQLWEQAGFAEYPPGDWYSSVGQGMGDTLRFANEVFAYTLTDRGTFLALRDNLPDLTVLVGGDSIDQNQDETLFNPYGVIPVNPDKGGNHELAVAFALWLQSDSTQMQIEEFGMEQHNQPLFYPNANIVN
ncbi:MAG: substrate-binding domain-containing protein, partial [Chloroflexota bacterium]